MNKLVLPSFLLAAACACTPHVYSDTYKITVEFNHYDVKKLVEVHEYCMVGHATPLVVTVQGKTIFYVQTYAGIFSKCAFLHSSATYDVQDSHGKSVGVLEFYKPVREYPHLDLDSDTIKCQHINSLTLKCSPAKKNYYMEL